MTTNTNSTAYTRLLDDLLWLHARGNPDDGLREAVEAMLADYTDDANRYSDGSEVWKWYEEFPGTTSPPKVHCTVRRTAAPQHPTSTSTGRRSQRVDHSAGRAVRFGKLAAWS